MVVTHGARVLGVIAGHDQRDGTCAPRPVDDYVAALGGKSLKGARLGIPKEFFGEGLAPEVRAVCQNAMDIAQAQGAELVEVSLPHTDAAIATFTVLLAAVALVLGPLAIPTPTDGPEARPDTPSGSGL